MNREADWSTPDRLVAEGGDAKACAALQRDLGRYVSLPGQRAKAAKLARHARQAPHILAALRRARYREDAHDAYDLHLLAYWGLVLVALLDPATRADVLRDFLDGDYRLPFRDRHATLMHDALQAARSVVADDDASAPFGARLDAIAQARRDASEAAAWARELGLPLVDGEAWSVSIYVPHASNGGTPVMGKQLLLEVCSLPDHAWHVHLADPGDRQYSERPHGVARDDIGLPPLQRLARLPAWLRALPPGLEYDVARAAIFCKGLRNAKPRLQAWLRA